MYSQVQTMPEVLPDPIKKNSEKEKVRIFRYNRLTLQENPSKAPSALPRDFVPPKNSVLLFSTELKSERLLENRESVLILKNTYSKEIIETYYEVLISQLGYKILQSQKTEQKSLYLVEVFNRKTVAISVLPDGDGSIIKLFHRTSGGF